MNNEGKARLLGALVPLALVQLLVSKGVITEDELNKAIPNAGSGKLKARLLGALVPLALVELLVSKGVITKDELDKAIANALREAVKRKVKTRGGEEGGT